MPRRLEASLYIGKKFNRYIVLKEIVRYKRVSITEVECKCDCGNIRIVPLTKIIRNHSTSCGCYQKEAVAKSSSIHRVSHGHTKTDSTTKKVYDVYHNMHNRCYDINNSNYKNYGGRGIKVCKTWRNSLDIFVAWCLDNGWKEGLHLDRKDNNKGYSPSNCRFVTPTDNHNNKRNNRLIIIIKGVAATATEHARNAGLSPSIVFDRIKAGWRNDTLLIAKGGVRSK